MVVFGQRFKEIIVDARVQKSKETYEGLTFESNNCGSMVISGFTNNKTVEVTFSNTGYKTVAQLQQIKKGRVKDKLIPSVYGVGIVGDIDVSVSGVKIKEYKVWNSMLMRCYDERLHVSQQTYKDCEVSENFKYFPYFKEWCNKQTGFNQIGWHLDKDILIKGNKIYSEDTCCFVPQEINALFTNRRLNKGGCPIGVHFCNTNSKYVAQANTGALSGNQKHLGRYDTPEEAFLVYKEAKEAYIKEVANKWKDHIDIKVYNALMCWTIEIDD